MTINEAREFIKRWRRILIPWRAKNDLEAACDMQTSLVGTQFMFAALLGVLFVRATEYGDSDPRTWKYLAGILAVASLFAFSLWLIWRLQIVRNLFADAGPKSFDELAKRDH
jgi:hypothetical protein